ncbi:hypothetical protein BpHYR1_006105, partial [Brachionus plicatilis]
KKTDGLKIMIIIVQILQILNRYLVKLSQGWLKTLIFFSVYGKSIAIDNQRIFAFQNTQNYLKKNFLVSDPDCVKLSFSTFSTSFNSGSKILPRCFLPDLFRILVYSSQSHVLVPDFRDYLKFLSSKIFAISKASDT